jgi:hypothetical protein
MISGSAGHYGVENFANYGWVSGVTSNFLFLDTFYGNSAYFQSSFFYVPESSTLTLSVLGHKDSVSLTIAIVVRDATVYTLDTLDPPKAQLGQQPISKTYALGSQLVGQNMAIRLGCSSTGSTGTFCDYASIIVRTQGNRPNSISTVSGGLSSSSVATRLTTSDSALQITELGTVILAILAVCVMGYRYRRSKLVPRHRHRADVANIVAKLNKYDYDVFICHASEDKREVAEPLAKMLMANDLKVWYDKFTLTVGDSLRRKIDNGLAQSRYGVVILSPSFFKRNWPQKELDGLAAREDSEGHKIILPVWHHVDRDYVVKYSPTLADRLASNTTEGLKAVLEDLLEVILDSS